MSGRAHLLALGILILIVALALTTGRASLPPAGLSLNQLRDIIYQHATCSQPIYLSYRRFALTPLDYMNSTYDIVYRCAGSNPTPQAILWSESHE